MCPQSINQKNNTAWKSELQWAIELEGTVSNEGVLERGLQNWEVRAPDTDLLKFILLSKESPRTDIPEGSSGFLTL